MKRPRLQRSEGRRLLAAAVARSSLVALAAELRVSTSLLCRWASGERVPWSWHDRVALARLGIEPHLWDVPATDAIDLAARNCQLSIQRDAQSRT